MCLCHITPFHGESQFHGVCIVQRHGIVACREEGVCLCNIFLSLIQSVEIEQYVRHVHLADEHRVRFSHIEPFVQFLQSHKLLQRFFVFLFIIMVVSYAGYEIYLHVGAHEIIHLLCGIQIFLCRLIVFEHHVYSAQSHIQSYVSCGFQLQRVDEEKRPAIPHRRIRQVGIEGIGIGEIGTHVGCGLHPVAPHQSLV